MKKPCTADKRQISFFVHRLPGIHGCSVAIQFLYIFPVKGFSFPGACQIGFFSGQRIGISHTGKEPAAGKTVPVQHFFLLRTVCITIISIFPLKHTHGIQHLKTGIQPVYRIGLPSLFQEADGFQDFMNCLSIVIGTMAVGGYMIPNPPPVHQGTGGINGSHKIVQQAGNRMICPHYLID